MSTIVKKIVTLSLAATILAPGRPATMVVPDATMVFVPTMTRVPSMIPVPTTTHVPTTTPNHTFPTEQPVAAQLDVEIQLKVGEIVILDGGKLTIKFKSLASDLRCPEGIECVWAGNAEAILEVSKLEIALNTSLDGGLKGKVVGDYNIQLRDVLPHRKWGVEVERKPENYIIKIVVSKK